ncbi:MAG: hydroxymethylglutaryl-CoA lyase [Bdellovibrionales bacterium]|nr:hydroxymethylglutaryl-CoA lyase [Bdellovibrionales bacterium]
MPRVQIIEMSLRDGLQNEVTHLSVGQRFSLIKKLNDAGIRRMEIGAFVSPTWVPQMSESGKLIKKVLRAQKMRRLHKETHFSALVPNRKGLETALESGIKEIAVFGAASETFSQRNINCSISQSLKKFEEVIKEARANKIKVRGYLSTVFGCPYEGAVSQAKVIKLVEKYLAMGVYEISLGDTIGVATPKQVREILNKVLKMSNSSKIAMHFHDTRGTAIANILASLDLGIRKFDTSLGGLGGCPYAPGAAGNVATEDVVYMLHGMGYTTGLDLQKLIKTTQWMSRQVGRQLPSKLSLTGG